ncbi:MAG: MFS transporter [SAR202 cluster bacterium]|nr:MFS transporter [SAR202 cluster bacterium]
MYTTALSAVRRRWHIGIPIVAIAFLASALSIGSSNYTFGFFVEPLEADFGWSRTAIGGALSFAAIGSLTTPILGRIMDTKGAKPVLVFSLTVLAISFLVRPLMTELWHFYALSVVQFIFFAGANTLPAGRLVGIWFPHKRGRVMGIVMMGNNFGGLTISLMTGYFIAIGGWASAYVATGVLALGITLLAFFIVHERIAADQSKGVNLNKELPGFSVREALRTNTFYIMTVALAFGSFTYSILLPHISVHLLDEGTSNKAMVTLASLLAAFGMGGKLAFGYLADRYSARQAMILSLAGQIVFITLIAYFPTGNQIWIVVPLFGFFFGAFGVLGTLLVQECFGLRYFGSISGISGIIGIIPTVTGPLIAGTSSDTLGSYAPAFVFTGFTFVLAIGLLGILKHPDLKNAKN